MVIGFMKAPRVQFLELTEQVFSILALAYRAFSQPQAPIQVLLDFYHFIS
jgi:hypothetical protein